jgi:hypothetical protein
MEFSRQHCSDHRVSRDIHVLCIRTDWLRTVQDDHVHSIQRTAVQCVASVLGSRNHR